MSQELQEDSTNHSNRIVLGNVSNTLGKRPLPFDLDKPFKSTKTTPNQQIIPPIIQTKTLKGKIFQEFQDFLNPKEKSTTSSNTRPTGNYFAKENYEQSASTNRSWYFKHLMRGPGAQREPSSPESEDNFEEDYESDNEETGKSNPGFSSTVASTKNAENSKLDSFACLDKSCNCSFCIKASYMWMDLNYQDTRGRLSALKRSRRLARSVVGKVYGQENKNKAIGENLNEGAKMEFELMQHLKSLFTHTESLFARETAKLHGNFMSLEEMRENCKRDLYTISGGCASNE